MLLLTDISVRKAKPKEKPYKLHDEKGLYLLVTPSGSKWWRMDYTFQGRRNTISLATYPEVRLKEAREKRDEMRKLIAQGIDPAREKKRKMGEGLTFGELAREWFETKKASWAPGHAQTVLGRIKNYIEPALGSRKVQEITAPELFEFLLSV